MIQREFLSSLVLSTSIGSTINYCFMHIHLLYLQIIIHFRSRHPGQVHASIIKFIFLLNKHT